MTIREELARDLANGVAGYGQTFEWQGDTYACVRRDTPTMSELQDLGEVKKGTTWLVVAKSVLPAEGAWPDEGDLVDCRTRIVRAVNGTRDDGASQLILRTESVDG